MPFNLAHLPTGRRAVVRILIVTSPTSAAPERTGGGVGLALALERHCGGRSELLAHEELGVLVALPWEDEVVRHAVPHVRVAVFVFVLVVVAHAQLHAPAVVGREGRSDRGARGEVQGLRHGAVLAEPELEV
eukprot:CAMPEP_0113838456 /NCGR_PEP_ID=MMETSP0328-20130328/10548_1 /TAXON_ID=39455 /ORGANISM="Alexandrium minutum" /LENGTH=131 /DNA_ID=CAMNT_0000806989 /DNA_START=116 /DNA_END=509 /DNA_ORIENTATION=- /assembly_acc=CAM_ASM_000350